MFNSEKITPNDSSTRHSEVEERPHAVQLLSTPVPEGGSAAFLAELMDNEIVGQERDGAVQIYPAPDMVYVAQRIAKKYGVLQ
jgi:hypothetical protein